MLKFNLQPTAPAESVTDNPSIATEELDLLPAVQEESLETDDFDLFGTTSSLPTATEEIDSNEVAGEESSVLEGMPHAESDEIEETAVLPASPTKSKKS